MSPIYGRPLLAGRAEDAEVVAVERESEIIAVRARVRHPALHVQRPTLRQCIEQILLDVGVIGVE